MAAPTDSSQPRLAAGCRWSMHNGSQVVLYPEGMIQLKGTAHDILQLCDGERTIQQILKVLAERYCSADPHQIKEDVGRFLVSLKGKRIVDYE